MGQWIELTAADGRTISAWRAEPKDRPRGGLVVVQEIFGVNSHIRSVCDGYAADGYLAVAPALFDRSRPRVELGYAPDDIERGRELKAKATLEHALADVAAARDAAAAAGKVGIVGYCWGGLLTWRAACALHGLSAAVPYYGGGMTAPAEAARKPLVPVLAHFGDQDQWIPLDTVKAFEQGQPGVQVQVYAANHGFNCDHRASYNADAARLALQRTLAFFAQHVG